MLIYILHDGKPADIQKLACTSSHPAFQRLVPEMIPCPVIEATVPPTATAAQPELSDQIGPQQPFSGAVDQSGLRDNQPAMPSQVLVLEPDQAHTDTSAVSQASYSSYTTSTI